MKRLYSGMLAILMFAAMLVFTVAPASQVRAETTTSTTTSTTTTTTAPTTVVTTPTAATTADNSKPAINFYGEYKESEKKLVLTACVHNPSNQVTAAMFILEYDKTKLSISASGVKPLNPTGFNNLTLTLSNVYCSQGPDSGSSPTTAPSTTTTTTTTAAGGSTTTTTTVAPSSSINSTNRNFVGADWFYSPSALPAQNAEMPAVELTFNVLGNPTADELERAIKVTDNENYLKDKTYDDDGGILICEDGEKYYNAKINNVGRTNTAGNSITIETTTTTGSSNTTSSTTESSTSTTTSSTTSTTRSSTTTTTTSRTTTTTKASGGTGAKTGDSTRDGLPFAIAALIVSGFVAATSAVTIKRKIKENKSDSANH